MDCSRTSIRQGASEVTLVYRRDMKDMPAADEVHEAIEEGVTAIFQAGPMRVLIDDRGKVTGVEFIRMQLGEPDASGRRRPEPRAGHRVHDPMRPGPAGDRPGPRARLARRRPATRASRRRRIAGSRRTRVTFSTARPGVFGTGDVRIGAATVVEAIAEGRRAAYAVDAYLKGIDLDAIRTRQTLAEPQPEFLSIVPFTAEVKEPRYRLTALPAEERNHNYMEYELPVHAAKRRSPNRRAACSARARRSGSATCAAWGSSTARRSRRSSRSTTRAPGSGASRRTASPASTTTTSATTRTRSSCASRRAASTAGAARTCAPRWSVPRATTSCASASTRSSRRRST